MYIWAMNGSDEREEYSKKTDSLIESCCLKWVNGCKKQWFDWIDANVCIYIGDRMRNESEQKRMKKAKTERAFLQSPACLPACLPTSFLLVLFVVFSPAFRSSSALLLLFNSRPLCQSTLSARVQCVRAQDDPLSVFVSVYGPVRGLK